MIEYIPLLMFVAVFLALLAGYAVAPTLGGVALLFAFIVIFSSRVSTSGARLLSIED